MNTEMLKKACASISCGVSEIDTSSSDVFTVYYGTTSENELQMDSDDPSFLPFLASELLQRVPGLDSLFIDFYLNISKAWRVTLLYSEGDVMRKIIKYASIDEGQNMAIIRACMHKNERDNKDEG